jgi:hypothetical protein
MRSKQLLAGLFYLVVAGLSAYFLVWYGTSALLAAVAVKALHSLANPEEPRPVDVGDMANTGAIMASVGLCLTICFLVLAIRRFVGKAYPSRHTSVAFLLFSACFVGGTVVIARSMIGTAQTPAPVGYADIEGIWQRADDEKSTYRLNPDGSLDSWWSGMPHGKMGTWVRSGRTITVVYQRDWQFAGTLTGNSIKGTMSVTSTGKPLGTVEWVRTVRP